MKKGHELKIRERLSKSYLQVIFIASISAIVGIIALLVMTRMYNNALNNYGFSQGDIGKAMTHPLHGDGSYRRITKGWYYL